MTQEKMSPLRARMMEDMRIRGMRASEVCTLKISDIDSNRMLTHVDQGMGGKDRKVMLSPGIARPVARVLERGAT